MNATYQPLEEEAGADLYQEMETLIKKNPRAWQSVCAVFGLAGGVISPILGALADVFTWFLASESVNSDLQVVSIVLCALTLPLLMLGAFSLDSLQRKTADPSPPDELLRDELTTKSLRDAYQIPLNLRNQA